MFSTFEPNRVTEVAYPGRFHLAKLYETKCAIYWVFGIYFSVSLTFTKNV